MRFAACVCLATALLAAAQQTVELQPDAAAVAAGGQQVSGDGDGGARSCAGASHTLPAAPTQHSLPPPQVAGMTLSVQPGAVSLQGIRLQGGRVAAVRFLPGALSVAEAIFPRRTLTLDWQQLHTQGGRGSSYSITATLPPEVSWQAVSQAVAYCEQCGGYTGVLATAQLLPQPGSNGEASSGTVAFIFEGVQLAPAGQPGQQQVAERSDGQPTDGAAASGSGRRLQQAPAAPIPSSSSATCQLDLGGRTFAACKPLNQIGEKFDLLWSLQDLGEPQHAASCVHAALCVPRGRLLRRASEQHPAALLVHAPAGALCNALKPAACRPSRRQRHQHADNGPAGGGAGGGWLGGGRLPSLARAHAGLHRHDPEDLLCLQHRCGGAGRSLP